MTQNARTFRGTLRPGPGKVVIRIRKEDESYTIPGTTKVLWIPRPVKHEGFFGTIEHEAITYFDVETGTTYEAIFKKNAVVLIGKFTGAPVTVNNDEFIVCRETDIVAELIPDVTETPLVLTTDS